MSITDATRAAESKLKSSSASVTMGSITSPSNNAGVSISMTLANAKDAQHSSSAFGDAKQPISLDVLVGNDSLATSQYHPTVSCSDPVAEHAVAAVMLSNLVDGADTPRTTLKTVTVDESEKPQADTIVLRGQKCKSGEKAQNRINRCQKRKRVRVALQREQGGHPAAKATSTVAKTATASAMTMTAAAAHLLNVAIVSRTSDSSGVPLATAMSGTQYPSLGTLSTPTLATSHITAQPGLASGPPGSILTPQGLIPFVHIPIPGTLANAHLTPPQVPPLLVPPLRVPTMSTPTPVPASARVPVLAPAPASIPDPACVPAVTPTIASAPVCTPFSTPRAVPIAPLNTGSIPQQGIPFFPDPGIDASLKRTVKTNGRGKRRIQLDKHDTCLGTVTNMHASHAVPQSVGGPVISELHEGQRAEAGEVVVEHKVAGDTDARAPEGEMPGASMVSDPQAMKQHPGAEERTKQKRMLRNRESAARSRDRQKSKNERLELSIAKIKHQQLNIDSVTEDLRKAIVAAKEFLEQRDIEIPADCLRWCSKN